MGTCPTNTDGSLTPFVAKYCTALGYDMDMMRTMSAQELICAMSEKLNEAVCFDNETREMMEQVQEEWENVKDSVGPEIIDAVNEVVNEYLASDEFKSVVDESVSQAVDDATAGYDARFEQIEGNVDSIQNTLGHVVNVLDYGADNTGTADSTSAVQNAVDSASEGDTLFFPHGTYMLGQVDLKSGVKYDLGMSSFEFTSNRGFVLAAPQRAQASLTEALHKGSKVLPASGGMAGELVQVRSLSNSETDRPYYLKGMLSKMASSSNMCDSPFYQIIQSGGTANFYPYTTCDFGNVGDFWFSEVALSSSSECEAFHFDYCQDVHVHDIHCAGHQMYAGISFNNSYCCSVERVNGTWQLQSGNTLCYPIQLYNAWHTVVRGCDIVSPWHCVALGGNYGSCHTEVSSCNLVSTGTDSFGSHSNCYGLSLHDCSLSSAHVSARSNVERCTITDTAGSPLMCRLLLEATSIEEVGPYYNVSDCTFDSSGSPDNTNQRFGIGCYWAPQTTSSFTVHFGNISVNRVASNIDLPFTYNFPYGESAANTAFEHTSWDISECNRIYVFGFSGTGDTNVDNVKVRDCTVDTQQSFVMLNEVNATDYKVLLENIDVKSVGTYLLSAYNAEMATFSNVCMPKTLNGSQLVNVAHAAVNDCRFIPSASGLGYVFLTANLADMVVSGSQLELNLSSGAKYQGQFRDPLQDKSIIFMDDGTNWYYGEISSGSIVWSPYNVD